MGENKGEMMNVVRLGMNCKSSGQVKLIKIIIGLDFTFSALLNSYDS